MIKYQINDNELLYLIYEKNDYAFDLLCTKYTPMIKRRIKDYRVDTSFYDDYFQEGLIMLDVAIKTYKENTSKSFNKYFDLILSRRIIQLLKKDMRYQRHIDLMGDIECLQLEEKNDLNLDYLSFDLKNLSKFEEEIITKIYFENYRAGDISKEMNISLRSVYNAISRAKNKMRKGTQ